MTNCRQYFTFSSGIIQALTGFRKTTILAILRYIGMCVDTIHVCRGTTT